MSITLADRLDAAMRVARKVKEDHVRSVKGKRGRTDILTVVQSWRGTELVASVFTRPDRDRMLKVASISSRGFAADMLVLIMETYLAVADSRNNPETGEEWGPDEMGQYFEKHGPDNGLVTESLVLMAFNRAGDELSAALPYRITRRVVEWSKEPQFDDGQSGGRVPHAMKIIMEEPTGHQVMAKDVDLTDMPEDLLYAAADAATVLAMRSLIDADLMVMMYAEPGSQRHGIMRRTFSPSEISDPRKWS